MHEMLAFMSWAYNQSMDWLEQGFSNYGTCTTCGMRKVVRWYAIKFIKMVQGAKKGPGSSSGKALGYGLDGPGSIPGVGGVEIFLCSFVSRLVLRSTQPPIK